IGLDGLAKDLSRTGEEPFELPLDDVIIMQSTGLFDKNGKEIFVGDVVKCYTVTENGEYEYIGVVYLKDFAFVIVDEKDTYDPLWNYKSGFVGIETEIEIIGNIYQNPELVEETND
ncbi:YopX family protein, partial [Streptococcus suis]|uniref:YopX family protein n=1 Tax=Streptococcus suis TaxID=1307 RepID=UPI0023D96E80